MRLALPALLLAAACDQKPDPPAAPQARSQAVQATGPAAPSAPAAPAAAPVPSAAARKEVICAHQLGQEPKDVPKAAVSRAGQVASLPEKLPVGPGHWTWINLWAAWCVPCREEMPRLLSWEQKTASERTTLKVAFVSIDDDARQLETFLSQQPPTGIHAAYWLKDGPERVKWLKEAGMPTEPELPAHVLVDPLGRIRCRQQGAIEDGDLVEVFKMLRGERGGKLPDPKSAGKTGDGKHGFGPG